jgi:HAD superfamily hydrolase (TIGR01509 family)
VITGDDVAEAKPAPDVFVAAAERLGVSVSDSVVIGDSVWDLLAAGRKTVSEWDCFPVATAHRN